MGIWGWEVKEEKMGLWKGWRGRGERGDIGEGGMERGEGLKGVAWCRVRVGLDRGIVWVVGRGFG